MVAKDLAHPWGLAFLPDGRFLVTERPGRLRVVEANGRVGAPVAGVPPVVAQGQGGLLDVVTDSAFAQNRTVYLCYSEPDTLSGRTNSTALASARLSDDGTRLEGLRVLFSQRPKVASSAHFGCRIVESGPTLFLTLGDRFRHAADAQTLDNHHGKVVRIGKDGTVPKDNPFVNTVGAKPEIWSYGHRNAQGAALGADGTLWMHEHGPQGGDEINLSLAGKNYGWPVITYGENYGGGKIGEGEAGEVLRVALGQLHDVEDEKGRFVHHVRRRQVREKAELYPVGDDGQLGRGEHTVDVGRVDGVARAWGVASCAPGRT